MEPRFDKISRRERTQLDTLDVRVETTKQEAISEISANLAKREGNEHGGDARSIFNQRWSFAQKILTDNLAMNDAMIDIVNQPGYTPVEVERQQVANASRIERAKQWMEMQFQDEGLLSEETARRLTILAGELDAYGSRSQETI